MLKKVYIRNFALLEEMEISFSAGFNVLTGETGAGKSLVINALNSILGEKVSSDILRRGARKAVVEGTFEGYPEGINQVLEENELDLLQDELLLRRELNQSGRSRTFINDCLTHIELLKQISNQLVDLHGQHEHQSLLSPENHLHFLDDFGGLNAEVDMLRKLYEEFHQLQNQLEFLQKNARQLREKKDFLDYQIQEIESLHLTPEEEDELLQEEKILNNYEKIINWCHEIHSHLYEAEGSVYSLLSNALEKVEGLAGIDSSFSEYGQQLAEANVRVEEVARFIHQYASRTDYDPQRLEEIRERLAQISRLKKKYGLPLLEILRKHEQNKKEILQIENLDEELEEIGTLLQEKKSVLQEMCDRLSRSRKKVAEQFEQKVTEGLHQIGMENARFLVNFGRYKTDQESGIVLDSGEVAKSHGTDRVEFYVSTNPGADFMPLARIASGGELSRIMLAIKSVMAGKDEIGVLVFDEIDIGISGRIAEAVGRKLKQLSRSHQIICVTHLPQIARFADKHYSIRKQVKNGETFAFIHELNFEQRVQELAYLLGGEKITAAVLKNAEELLISSEP